MQDRWPSSDHVLAVAVHVVTHPWQVFVKGWNWKAALLSALFRGVAFALPLAGVMRGGLRSICIEVGFRFALGGFWGSLLQAFCRAQPTWLAAFSVVVVLPALAHGLEFSALRASHATHLFTAMTVSVAISAGSLLFNLGLMRRGLLLTGRESAPLWSDLRRIPAALAAMGFTFSRNLLSACRRIAGRPGSQAMPHRERSI
jgi:hypothetical protein